MRIKISSRFSFIKKIAIFLILFIILVIVIVLLRNSKIIRNNNNKIINSGNNNIQEIEKYLLNIDSYTANIDVIITSNKNENKYKIIQDVNKGYEKQIVVEPEEIANIEMIYENGTLKIKNPNIDSSKDFSSYQYIANNPLFLTDFIKEYKETDKKEIIEDSGKIELNISNYSSRYSYNKKMRVNKGTLKPESIEIKDMNNDVKVYILYNEIEINSI